MIATSREDGWNVLELSSFQLETIRDFHAHVGLALNVTQNHLDRHHTFENYAAAKASLFRNMTAGDFAILNADDPVTAAYATRRRQPWNGSAARAKWSAAPTCAARNWCSTGSS